jgi:hypothetical protein
MMIGGRMYGASARQATLPKSDQLSTNTTLSITIDWIGKCQ